MSVGSPPPVLSDGEVIDILHDYSKVDRKFKRVCQEIRQINNKLEGLHRRYQTASAAGKHSVCYTLRLQIATVGGVRDMFYEYACRRSNDLEDLQDELADAGLLDYPSEDEVEEEVEGEERGGAHESAVDSTTHIESDGVGDEKACHASDGGC